MIDGVKKTRLFEVGIQPSVTITAIIYIASYQTTQVDREKVNGSREENQ